MSATNVESLPPLLPLLDGSPSEMKDDLLNGLISHILFPGSVSDGAGSNEAASSGDPTSATNAAVRDAVKTASTTDAPLLAADEPLSTVSTASNPVEFGNNSISGSVFARPSYQTIHQIVNRRIQELGCEFSAFLELKGWELDTSMVPWMVKELPSNTDLLILAWIMEFCDEDNDSNGNLRVDDFRPRRHSLLHWALLRLFGIEGGHVAWNVADRTGNPAISAMVHKYSCDLRRRKLQKLREEIELDRDEGIKYLHVLEQESQNQSLNDESEGGRTRTSLLASKGGDDAEALVLLIAEPQYRPGKENFRQQAWGHGAASAAHRRLTMTRPRGVAEVDDGLFELTRRTVYKTVVAVIGTFIYRGRGRSFRVKLLGRGIKRMLPNMATFTVSAKRMNDGAYRMPKLLTENGGHRVADWKCQIS
ncbi:hypothetical protein BDZ89DRAFT_1040025 [Hymenopellis radicata]|nr:hypothetical protein BDZ89DRAFT_1040025 [Hymenopellis radicata]